MATASRQGRQQKFLRLLQSHVTRYDPSGDALCMCFGLRSHDVADILDVSYASLRECMKQEKKQHRTNYAATWRWGQSGTRDHVVTPTQFVDLVFALNRRATAAGVGALERTWTDDPGAIIDDLLAALDQPSVNSSFDARARARISVQEARERHTRKALSEQTHLQQRAHALTGVIRMQRMRIRILGQQVARISHAQQREQDRVTRCERAARNERRARTWMALKRRAMHKYLKIEEGVPQVDKTCKSKSRLKPRKTRIKDNLV